MSKINWINEESDYVKNLMTEVNNLDKDDLYEKSLILERDKSNEDNWYLAKLRGEKLANRPLISVMYVSGAYSDNPWENVFAGTVEEYFTEIKEALEALEKRFASIGIKRHMLETLPIVPQVNTEYIICNRYVSVKIMFKEVYENDEQNREVPKIEE